MTDAAGGTYLPPSSLRWSLGDVEVGAGPVTRSFSLEVELTVPAVDNTLTVTATVAALESDAQPADNSDSVVMTISAVDRASASAADGASAHEAIGPSVGRPVRGSMMWVP